MTNDPDSEICPVCGRPTCVHEDGTLYWHYMSFFNQDDPTGDMCLGSELQVRPAEEKKCQA